MAAPMETAVELAQRFGEASGDDVLGFAFGPTESGDPDQALSIAEDMHPEQHPHSSRRAAYWVDCGRTLARLRGRRDEAVLALRRAEAISPHHVHRNPMVRDVPAELVSRARHDLVGRELRGMAYRAGLPV